MLIKEALYELFYNILEKWINLSQPELTNENPQVILNYHYFKYK